MKRLRWLAGFALLALAIGAFWTLAAPPAQAENPCAATSNPCNPCAAANPCAAKNPCAAANPCAAKNPCNPCGGNPCNPGGGGAAKAEDFTEPAGLEIMAATPALVTQGEALWNDKSLSSNGLACATCHVGNSQMNASFAKPYPHRVAMPHQMAGVAEVSAAEMVQFCMLTPMASEALAWDSVELAALVAYVGRVQSDFVPPTTAGANPCNPCGGKNPCNPCGR